MERLEFRQAHVADLRDRFEATLADRIPGVHLNGHPQLRVPHVSNVSFEGVEGEGLLIALDLQGIAVATGAACAAGATEPSHVLTALGLSAETIHGSLRFSFSELNTVEEVDYVLEVLPGIVARLRDNAVDTAGIGS
jgi:cysteine desulfurase